MKVCCSSPASIRFWVVTSVAAWAVLATVGRFWYRLHGTSAVTILLAMAAGCFANAVRNRTYHCVVTSPLFLVAAVLFLSANLTRLGRSLVWMAVLAGTGIAFLLEWRCLRRLADTSSKQK